MAKVEQYVTIKYQADTTEIKNAQTTLRQLQSTINGLGKSSGVGKIDNELKSLSNSAKSTSASLQHVGNGANVGSGGITKLGASIGISSSLFSSLINIAQQAGQALIQFGKESIKSASDFNENTNKTLAVFGEAGQKFIDQSGKMASTIGMSKNTYLESVSLFGAIAKAMGLPTEKSMEMSESLTGLAADLSSFYNKDIQQSMTALKGALTGETEALKEFGIVANDTNMKPFAESLGYTWDSLDAGTKAMLRYQYIMENTKFIQGDFARTSDGLANSSRSLAENFENLKVKIGQGLLPLFQGIINKANQFMMALTTPSKDLQATLQSTNSSIESTKQQLANLEAQGITTGSEYEQLKSKLDGELKVKANAEQVIDLQNQLKNLQPIFDIIKVACDNLWFTIQPVVNLISGIFKGVMDALAPLKPIFDDIALKFQQLGDALFGGPEGRQQVLDFFNNVGYVIGVVIGGAIGSVITVVDLLINAVVGLIDWFKWLWNNIITSVQMVKQAWDDTFGAMFAWFGQKWNELLGWFSSLPSKVSEWASQSVQWFKDKWNGLVGWFNDLWDRITSSFWGWVDSLKQGFNDFMNSINPANWFKSGTLNVYNSPLGGNALGGLPNTQNINYNYNIYTKADPSLSFIARQKAMVEGGQAYNFNRPQNLL